MSCRITASWETLLEQASKTSDQYFNWALDTILKARYERGVAPEQPGENASIEDINAAIKLAKIAASDFTASVIGIAAQNIADGLSRIASALESQE